MKKMKQTLLTLCLIIFALPSWGQTTFSGGSISGGKISIDKPTRAGYFNNISPYKHAFEIVSSPHPVRYGNNSERFEVRDGDCGGSDCGAPRYRSEIGINKGNTQARIGEDIWYGWSFLNHNIPTFQSNENLFITIGQWKMGGGNKPIFKISQLGIDDDKHWRLCSEEICNKKFKTSPYEDVFIQLGDMNAFGGFNNKESNWGSVCRLFSLSENKGKWVDIVLNTNFSDKEDGYLNIWINDKKKCEYNGRIVIKKDFSMYPGPNHRRGIFVSNTKRWDGTYINPAKKKPTLIVYYDEFRVGKSREEVDIRILENKNFVPVD